MEDLDRCFSESSQSYYEDEDPPAAGQAKYN